MGKSKRKVNPITASLKNVEDVRSVLEWLRDDARKLTAARPYRAMHKDELLFYTEKPAALLRRTEKHLRVLIKEVRHG